MPEVATSFAAPLNCLSQKEQLSEQLQPMLGSRVCSEQAKGITAR